MNCYQSKLTGDDKHFQPEYKALKVNHFKLLSRKYLIRAAADHQKILIQLVICLIESLLWLIHASSVIKMKKGVVNNLYCFPGSYEL